MRVTSFLLADAAQEVGGKLYVIGGGWNIITAVQPPPISHRHLALVALLGIGWNEANEPIEFEINLVHEDGEAVIPEPVRGRLTIGRPPLLPKGAEQLVPLVVNFDDLNFKHLGGYVFTFQVGDKELARAPFHIIAAK